MIGLETSISVLSAVLRHEPTGCSKEFRGDAVATAKRDLKPGELLDVKAVMRCGPMPSGQQEPCLAGLPIGLAHNVKLKRPVARDQIVSIDDVELEADLDVVALRRQMEDAARPKAARSAA